MATPDSALHSGSGWYRENCSVGPEEREEVWGEEKETEEVCGGAGRFLSPSLSQLVLSNRIPAVNVEPGATGS